MTLPTTAPPITRRRWFLWLPLLGLSAWLALFGNKSPPNESAAIPARAAAPGGLSPATATRPGAGPEMDADLPVAIARETLIPKPGAARPARDLFTAHNWNPPTPPLPTSAGEAQPPAPSAPPIPYSFLGKKLESDSWEVYLARGEKTYVAREGQVLEDVWRVDKIAPPRLTLTYLPLDQSQTHSIGDVR